MIRDKRKNFNIGGSKGITYPHVIAIGEESTLAGNRLLVIDPQGKVPPELLLKFHEQHIEPHIHDLLQQIEKKASEK